MQVTNDMVLGAARVGVDVLSSNDVRVPAAQMEPLMLLRQILTAVATGQLILAQPAKPPSSAASASAPAPAARSRSKRKR